MSISVNSVHIAGNLVRDPELKNVGDTSVCNLTVAVNDRYKAKDGTFKEKTAFIAVTVWGKQAEQCAQSLGKGSSVFVEGKLDQEAWDDKATGKKVTKTKVTASTVHFIGERRAAAPAAKPVTPAADEDWT